MLRQGLTLYVVRHGETDWNAEKRYQGQTDIPLNDRGRAQAERNGRILKELVSDPSRVGFVASPLGRARETMQIARAAMGLDPAAFSEDARLREINFGHWEGELWDELPALDPEGFAARRADPWGWQPRGGESYRMLAERVGQWLAELDRDTIVVSHGGVSRVMRGHLLDIPSREIPRLEVPQDRVLVLARGRQEWV